MIISTVTRHVARLRPMFSGSQLKTAAVTLPRLACLEGVEPAELESDRPVWRGPPRVVEPIDLPPGTRVAALTSAMRAASAVKDDRPCAPMLPMVITCADTPKCSSRAIRQFERNATTTIGEFRARPHLRIACDTVRYVTGTPVGKIFDRSPSPSLALARQVIQWLLTDVGGLSAGRAGFLCDRDHKTILHGRDVIRAIIAERGVNISDDMRLDDLADAILDAPK